MTKLFNRMLIVHIHHIHLEGLSEEQRERLLAAVDNPIRRFLHAAFVIPVLIGLSLVIVVVIVGKRMYGDYTQSPDQVAQNMQLFEEFEQECEKFAQEDYEYMVELGIR